MSILIKGMEMPKDCPMCPMAHWNKLDEFTGCEIKKRFFSKEELNTDYRPAFCPLIPVPPHGRLGDLDALAQRIEHERFHHTHTDGLAASHHVAEYGHFLMAISYAPTIIPAEEGET